MKRYALGIEYDGSHYAGWQRQRHLSTIQGISEAALSKIANETISLFCAGRTDAGVHATGQIVHFDTHASRPNQAWVQGVNRYLPKDIRVTWAKEVAIDFDARRSALARRYCYVMSHRDVASGIMHGKTTWVNRPLDVLRMHQAAQALLGEHDFSTFRAAHCQAKTAIRDIQAIEVFAQGEFVFLTVRANAFLYHMVRNIVGALMAVGWHKQPIEWIPYILSQKDRKLAAVTAQPQGLYFTDVYYPAHFEIPRAHSRPWFEQISKPSSIII